MKAITIIQPYATAIMIEIKSIETRSWKTSYRGQIAIHASKGFPPWAKKFAEVERALGRIPALLPFGAIIGFATIIDVVPTEELHNIAPIEKIYGDYSPGRWGWILTEIEPLDDDKIIPCKGALGLWEWRKL